MSGDAEPAGLARLLEHADDYRAISASTPGETIAVVEYLLAICYAADCYPETSGEWHQWVHSRRSLADAAQWLIAQPAEEWDLLHPVQPLGQNALLAPYLDEHGVGPAQLVLEHAGDYNQLFDHHHLEHPEPLPIDAAFRAMLTQHAYGPGMRGRISGSLLGSTLNNLATGRLAARIRVLALGDTLGDTLRLNLQPYAGEPGTFNRSWTDGRTRRTFTTKPPGRTPDGPADLHSVLGRSILMRPTVTASGDLAIDRVLVGAGEILAPLPETFLQDAILVTYGKAMGPLRPSAVRQLWRESHALYAAVAEREKGSDLYGRLGMLSGRRVTLWAVGLVTEGNKLATWVSDHFPFVPGREAELRQAAEAGSQIAEYTATALGKAAYTAWTLAYPNPKPADKKSQMARFDATPEHWAATADLFHALLEATAEGTPVPEAIAVYAKTLVNTATTVLGQRLDSLPPNSRGFQARAQAHARLAALLTDAKAPHYLKEAASRDH
ncbi:type I-E CRISPR-associated protein Cse1/CasA [Streptomyces sp. NPDC004647]|uniref:type I-E CRISPR-associated protein Cse1/CasA n=1 Tax=Streptomyces sp. NPDC004647 TaxID=3154671 RepID=UPI0033B86BD0